MHMETVDAFIDNFREFDGINYLRYGSSWYFERIKQIEMDNLFCTTNSNMTI